MLYNKMPSFIKFQLAQTLFNILIEKSHLKIERKKYETYGELVFYVLTSQLQHFTHSLFYVFAMTFTLW